MSSKRYPPEFRAEAILQRRVKPFLRAANPKVDSFKLSYLKMYSIRCRDLWPPCDRFIVFLV